MMFTKAFRKKIQQIDHLRNEIVFKGTKIKESMKMTI